MKRKGIGESDMRNTTKDETIEKVNESLKVT